MNSTLNGNHSYGHGLDPSFSIFISTYFILLMLCAIIFNGILIHIIVKCTWLHSTTNTLIVNMAVSNILLAVCVLPFEFHFIVRGHYDLGYFVCGLKETIFMFSLPSQIVNLLLMTFERLIKILLPYRYESIFRKRVVQMMIVITWSYTLFVALFPFILAPLTSHPLVHVKQGKCWTYLTIHYIFYQIMGNFITPIVFIVGMNLKIFCIAQRHYRDIQLQTNHLNVHTTSKSKARNFTANFKAAKTVMMLFVVYSACWLTYILIVIANVACSICHPRELTWTSNAINYSSVALSPMLYGLRNVDIRKVVLRKYTRMFCCRDVRWSQNDEMSYLRSPIASPNTSPNVSMTLLTNVGQV